MARRLASKSGFLGTQDSDFQKFPDLDILPDLLLALAALDKGTRRTLLQALQEPDQKDGAL